MLDHATTLVNQHDGWQSLHAELERERAGFQAALFEQLDPWQWRAAKEVADRVSTAVDVDAYDLDPSPLVSRLQLLEQLHVLFARLAPSGPVVQHNRPATQRTKLERLSIDSCSLKLDDFADGI